MPPKQAEPIEPYLDPLKFYNHGDNPAMKSFLKIAMENSKDGRVIDHRTYVIDKGQRSVYVNPGISSLGIGMISFKEICRLLPSLELSRSSS